MIDTQVGLRRCEDCGTSTLRLTSGPGRRFRMSRGHGTFAIPASLVIYECETCGYLLNGDILDVLAEAERKAMLIRRAILNHAHGVVRGGVPLSYTAEGTRYLRWCQAMHKPVWAIERHWYALLATLANVIVFYDMRSPYPKAMLRGERFDTRYLIEWLRKPTQIP